MNAQYPTERTEWSPVGAIRQDTAEHYANLFLKYYPEWADRCDGRIARAIKICSTPGACKQHPDTVNRYLVKSQSNPKGHYVVDVREKSCTCPDAGRNNAESTAICKHRLAIAFHLLGPQWTGEDQTAGIQARYKLAALEDQRFELAESFHLLAHQCRHNPEERTEENRSEIIRILDQARQVQTQINEIIESQ